MNDRIPPAPNPEDPVLNLINLDLAALTALNNKHARETSLLSEEQFAGMLQMAFYARGFGPAFTPAALLIAFNQQALYEDRKSTRLNSSHNQRSRMPSSA